MVWTRGGNGLVPYGQKVIHGGSKWSSCKRLDRGLRLMNGVKVALGRRGMTVESGRQCPKDWKG